MRTILNYLKKYLVEHFHVKLYASTAVFLTICIALNYYFDFEDSYLDSFTGQWIKWPLMSLTMAFPFLGICILLYVFDIQRSWLNSKEFWLKFVIGFLIIGFDRSFFLHYGLMEGLPRVDYVFTFRVAAWGRSLLVGMVPVLLFYYFYERRRDEEKHWYGLTLKNFDFKPYLFLILIVFVGIGIASFLSELNQYYPRYKYAGGTAFATAHDLNAYIPVMIYEAVYGAYFITVELFFRGFLVIAFARTLGGHAVIAMVGSYVFLHFGKPVSETISSVFGGYLIGILAFYSHRIWGGVVLHVALAWCMELFAYWQNLMDQ